MKKIAALSILSCKEKNRLNMRVNLLFKTFRAEPFQLDENDDIFIVAGPAELIRQWPMLWRWSTILERTKLALKIVARRSVFFGIRSSEKLVSTGVLAIGYCRHYKVEPEAIVIVTIHTDPKRRGEGLATRSIKMAMNAMIERGHSVFYIDTGRGNIAMQRSIDRLGFGPPVDFIESQVERRTGFQVDRPLREPGLTNQLPVAHPIERQ
jgi:RimJ/RimL family protein N-acetyltransferase